MMLRRGLIAMWDDRRKAQRRGLRGFESVKWFFFFWIARLPYALVVLFLEGLASAIVQHGFQSTI